MERNPHGKIRKFEKVWRCVCVCVCVTALLTQTGQETAKIVDPGVALRHGGTLSMGSEGVNGWMDGWMDGQMEEEQEKKDEKEENE